MIRHTLWFGWWTLVLGMVLAILLSAIRFGFPLLGQYREPIAELLSEQIGLPVTLEHLSTEWNGPFPKIEITGLEAFAIADNGPDVRFRFDSLKLELNLWDSLLLRTPLFQQLEAKGLYIRWHQRDGGWLRLPGQGSGASSVDMESMVTLLNIVMAQPEFRILESELDLVPESGPSRQIRLSELLFENTASEHQLSGDFYMPLLGENTELSFAARLEGDLNHPSTLEMPFYLQLGRLGTELLELSESPLPITDLSASAELWGNVNQFGLDYLRGKLSVERAWIDLPLAPLELNSSSTEFSLKPYSEGYQIQLRNTRMGDALGQVDFGSSQIELHRVAGELGLSRVLIKDLDLGLLEGLLSRYPLPDQVSEALAALKPQGSLRDFSIDLNDQQRGPSIRAWLHDVSIASWRGIPEIEGLFASVEMDEKGGFLAIDSPGLTLGFSNLYTEPSTYELARGSLSWEVGDASLILRSGTLELLRPEFSARGRFSIDLPFDPETQAYLDLLIGLEGADYRAASVLIPDVVTDPRLMAWLEQALKKGEVQQAGLAVHSPIRPLDDRARPSVELYVAAENIELDYQPPWPKINQAQAFVHLRDGGVQVDVTRGQILDSEMGRSVIAKPTGLNDLSIVAQIAGDLAKVDQLFRSESLRQTVGESLADWQLAGNHQSLIELGISLDGKQPPTVKVRSEVESGIFASEKQQLAITDISGPIQFDSSSGLSATEISASFLGREARASISSEPGQSTGVRFVGQWPVASLLDWAGVPLKEFVSGEIPVSAYLKLCAASNCRSSLSIDSNLKGTRVSGPDFLSLQPQQERQLSLQLELGAPLQLELDYGDQFSVAMRLGEQIAAHFALGGAPASIPADFGYRVSGSIFEIDVAEIFAMIAQINSSFSGGAGAAPKMSMDVEAQTLSLGSVYLKQVQARIQQLEREWQLSLAGPDVSGLIAWSQAQPAYRVALNQLYLHVPETESVQVDLPESDPEPTERSIFEAVPQVDFDIADLRWNSARLGRWRGSLRPGSSSVELNSIHGEMSDMELSGSASWIMTDRELTRVNLAYIGKDLGNTLQGLDEKRLIETESVEGRIALAWESAPWQVAGKSIYGNFRFATGKGRLLETSGGSGLLRLFGILNFNTLVRRLQLDFSDLFSTGVVFDSLAGNFLVEKGVARSVVPMEMKGPSAGMLADGAIDLGAKTLDMQVNVSLPLVSNTPLAAVLLGAPQIAGALFLIDKLIGDKIEKATSIAYTLTGGWDAPELKLLNREGEKQ